MNYRIVKLSPEYYQGKAYVHFYAWREAYRGLLPDQYLEKRTYEQCLRHTEENPGNTFVAVADNEVAGFVWYSDEAREYVNRKGISEINAIYVLKKYQKQGIGKALLNQCFEVMPHEDTVLFVLKGNVNAIGFYEGMGYRLTGKEVEQDTSYGRITELEMIRYGRT